MSRARGGRGHGGGRHAHQLGVVDDVSQAGARVGHALRGLAPQLFLVLVRPPLHGGGGSGLDVGIGGYRVRRGGGVLAGVVAVVVDVEQQALDLCEEAGGGRGDLFQQASLDVGDVPDDAA